MSQSPLTPENIVDHRMLRDAAISPDGRHVAYWQRRNFKPDHAISPDMPGTLWLADIAAGTSRRLLNDPPDQQDAVQVTDQRPQWSPDSRRLLFLSNRDSAAQRQIWLYDLDSGTHRQLTSLDGQVEWPVW